MAVEAAAIEVTLPAMGESVTEGTILEWHKQEGDTIEADEILVEVSTDKVDAEVPAPASGTIVAIHFAEGDTVQVGSVLAEIAAGAGDGGGSPNGDGGNGEWCARGRGAARRAGEIIDIITPAGGESVTEGTILEWAVKVGDAVEDGDTVVEISTDKVDMELPAPAAGTITELLAEEGDDGHRRPGHRAHAARRRRPRRRRGAGRADAQRRRPRPPAAAAARRRQGHPRRRARRRRRGRRPRRRHRHRPQRPHHQGRRARRRRDPAPQPRRGSRARSSRAARRCSPATWTSRARSRPRPRSARSPSRRWTRGASSSRTPARRSPSPT